MEIQQEDNGHQGRYFIEQEGELLAEIVYSWSGEEEITIHHTNVDEQLEGKGIGKQLVEKVVMYARQKSAKIIALCPFANRVINHTAEWKDILKQ